MKNVTTKLTLTLMMLIAVILAGCSMFADDDNDVSAPARAEATGIAFAKNTLNIDGAHVSIRRRNSTQSGGYSTTGYI